ARRERATLVDRQLTRARASLEAARASDGAAEKNEAPAYHAFDAHRTDDGERLWQDVSAAADRAEAAYRAADTALWSAIAIDGNRADARALAIEVAVARARLAERLHREGPSAEDLSRFDGW